MKIYTKTGDAGKTSLIGGKRVSKDHKRIEAYGSLDELVSYIGLIRDLHVDEKIKDSLLWIQDKVMICASYMACDNKNCNIPVINSKDIERIEMEIDAMNQGLEPLNHFVLPGGHPLVSHCHIARCICRRAERNMIHATSINKDNTHIFIYINRLSDYLFILARKTANLQGVKEFFWITR